MSGLDWQKRWDPFQDIQREVGRILGNLEPMNWRVPRPFPAVNLYDAGDRYILLAELAGVSAEEIDLSISGDTVTIRGERKRLNGVEDENYRRQERPFGRWVRTATMPERVQGSEIQAEFTHGILTVTIPKSEDARPRQITVKAPA